jgi:hypothetical protein
MRPDRMIDTRSARASTWARMWLESSTVRPAFFALANAVLEHRFHERVEPGRRLVEEQQFDIRGQS